MHIDTIGIYLNFYPCMTFVDPSRKCLGFLRGQPKSKLFGIHQGTQQHFQPFVSWDWSRDLQAGLLLWGIPNRLIVAAVDSCRALFCRHACVVGIKTWTIYMGNPKPYSLAIDCHALVKWDSYPCRLVNQKWQPDLSYSCSACHTMYALILHVCSLQGKSTLIEMQVICMFIYLFIYLFMSSL